MQSNNVEKVKADKASKRWFDLALQFCAITMAVYALFFSHSANSTAALFSAVAAQVSMSATQSNRTIQVLAALLSLFVSALLLGML